MTLLAPPRLRNCNVDTAPGTASPVAAPDGPTSTCGDVPVNVHSSGLVKEQRQSGLPPRHTPLLLLLSGRIPNEHFHFLFFVLFFTLHGLRLSLLVVVMVDDGD